MHRRTVLRAFFTLPLATIVVPKIFIFPPIKKLTRAEIIDYSNRGVILVSSRDMRIPLKLRPGKIGGR